MTVNTARATTRTTPERPPTIQQPEATLESTENASEDALTGICYRTPELQEAILEILDVELCQVVNEKELFRIRTLGNVNMPSVKEGDFAGFVNVENLSLSTREIKANGLRGLDGLKKIHLSIQPEQKLRTESFTGLKSVEELSIGLQQTGFPQLPELPNLKHLTVQGINTEKSDPSPFRNIRNLEKLDLRIVFGDEDAETPAEPYLIPVNLLKGNKNLKEVRIETWVTPYGHEVQLPEEIFKENPALEQVEIRYPRTFIEKQTFAPRRGDRP